RPPRRGAADPPRQPGSAPRRKHEFSRVFGHATWGRQILLTTYILVTKILLVRDSRRLHLQPNVPFAQRQGGSHDDPGISRVPSVPHGALPRRRPRPRPR